MGKEGGDAHVSHQVGGREDCGGPKVEEGERGDREDGGFLVLIVFLKPILKS